MDFMEVSGNENAQAYCSDNQCPCGSPGAVIPRGQGYMYVSPEVVAFRKDCLTEKSAMAVINVMAAMDPNSIMKIAHSPILMCETGARKRKLNLETAAEDARNWWKTGKVPLRATPHE